MGDHLKVGAKSIEILLADGLLKALKNLGLESAEKTEILNRMAQKLSQRAGQPIDVLSPSLFTDLAEEAIRERGEDMFKGLQNIDRPCFVLADKAPMVIGHKEGIFYFRRDLFEVILPVMPTQEYQRVVLKTFITHALLLALGKDEAEVQREDYAFVVKLLGSDRKALDLINLFNQVMG